MSPAAEFALPTALTPPRILMVDDAQDDLDMYAMFLRTVGRCQVTQAVSGLEGLQAFARERPDVVVLDVLLPEVDGIDICRHVRSNPENDRTAVLALTALPLDSARVESMIRAGSDALLIKPCLPELLLSEIRKLVCHGRTLRKLGVSQTERARELRAHSNRLHQRARDTHQFARELVRQTERLRLAQRAKATYADLPGLSLTLRQATRLWNANQPTCRHVLDALALEGFLVRTIDGQYRRFAR